MQAIIQKPKPPTEEELVRHLYNKVTGKPLSCNIAVVECNLYGDQEPWEIWDMHGGPSSGGDHDRDHDQCLYLFTELRKKSLTDSRYVRTVGFNGGTWRAEDSAHCIKAEKTKEPIGIKKRFRYENSKSNHDACWIMHEFSLHHSLLHNIHEGSNYVLCRIKQKDPNSARRKRFQNKEEIIAIDDDDKDNESPDLVVHQSLPLLPPNTPAEPRQVVIACTNNIGMRGGRRTFVPPPKPSYKKSRFAAEQLDCLHDQEEDKTVNVPEDRSTININTSESAVTSTSLTNGRQQEHPGTLVIDCPPLTDPNHATDDQVTWDLDRYTDWALDFSEKLLQVQGQLPQAMKETQIELLPNRLYEDKWMDWERL